MREKGNVRRDCIEFHFRPNPVDCIALLVSSDVSRLQEGSVGWTVKQLHTQCSAYCLQLLCERLHTIKELLCFHHSFFFKKKKKSSVLKFYYFCCVACKFCAHRIHLQPQHDVAQWVLLMHDKVWNSSTLVTCNFEIRKILCYFHKSDRHKRHREQGTAMDGMIDVLTGGPLANDC